MKMKVVFEHVGIVTNLNDAEMEDLHFYANSTWVESARIVESLRKMIWEKEYKEGMKRNIGRMTMLKQDRDDS
jgi:hypothetical protein